ncbi:MAG: hypothetical protein Q7S10_03065 [bacterium]|nr:hypothetical protein [bacterium]
MTEQEWLTSEDLFERDFYPSVVQYCREDRRVSTLLTTHAISRAIRLLDGKERKEAEKAIFAAYVLAEKEVEFPWPEPAITDYLIEFQKLAARGYEYGAAMDQMRSWEIRMQGGSSPKGEVQCSIWQLSRVLCGFYQHRWRALINTRQAIISSASEAERFLTRKNERLWQSNLIRDIYGNPFRSMPFINPAWLSWKDGVVTEMARSIYDNESFADMPALADNLEKAGCTHTAILGHCRSESAHVRGCWALDLILNKE